MDQPGSDATLAQLLARGPLPADTLARWGGELAEQLAAAHRTGTTHGNITPDAVVIEDDHARLTGFGQPTAADQAPPADIYALGGLLHHAGAAFHPRFTDLLARMGHPDPTQRPTAPDVADQLRRLVEPHAPAGEPATAREVPDLFGPPLEKRRGRRRRRQLIVGLVAVLLLVAAGGGTWWWLHRPHPVPQPRAQAIGDLRGADPCALVDTAALQRFGATRLDPDEGPVTGCSVAIRPNATDWFWASASLIGPELDDHDLVGLPFQRAGAITVYHAVTEPQDCTRYLVLPDRARIVAFAYRGTDNATAQLDLCAMADTVVQSTLRALDTPSLPRRPLTQPPNSLVWLDACTLVDEATLRSAVPGLDTGRRDKTHGGSSCQWGGDMAVADPPTVDVAIARSSPPANRADPSSGDTVTTIGGRSALVHPRVWYLTPRLRPFCRVEVAQRSFQGSYDRPEVEEILVDVHLTVATPPETQCAAATTIAQAITAKLPPAS